MLENRNEPIGSISSKSECKPDYEQMIKHELNRLNLNVQFQDIIFEYMGNVILRDKLAELVGELASEERQINASVKRLISQQEHA